MGRISGVTKGPIGANRGTQGKPPYNGKWPKMTQKPSFFAENNVFGLPRPSPVQPRLRFSIWGKSEKSEKSRPRSLNISAHLCHPGWIWWLPGDPAPKKLPGDALGSRFGAMRVRIRPKTTFWQVQAQNNTTEEKGKRQRGEKGKGKGASVVFFPRSD